MSKVLDEVASAEANVRAANVKWQSRSQSDFICAAKIYILTAL
ncbi:MAG: hypothetical protein PHS77_00630 [Gallionellaceae bacterium]|nr:hypothetical protein [Gallionellaceae bacterium]